MSTLSQKKYIDHLKQIKEAEDQVQLEIEKHRKLIDQEIHRLEQELEDAIATEKLKGKEIVEKSIQQAKDDAIEEANKIVEEAETKSKTISFQSDQQIIKDIIEILLSDLK